MHWLEENFKFINYKGYGLPFNPNIRRGMMTTMDSNINIGFIGFGLIGGSIARSLKKLETPYYMIAYNYNKDKPNKSLNAALSDGVLDEITTNLNERFCDCDYIFLCAPVLSNIAYLKSLKHIIKEDCILTDVGSVKGNIHKAVEELGLSSNFIGGHPMAGSEKTGYENSYALLLENAYYILTPTNDTKREFIDRMTSLIESMKAICMVLDYKEHDDITAAISHVPHIIAAELVNMVRTSDDTREKMRTLAAGGFKDITRIASSSPIMWQNICLTNTESIQKFLDIYIALLTKVSKALSTSNENYLFDIFESASIYRSSIPLKGRGIINQVYETFLDITDEPGSIATIATLLGSNNISIKNIGIAHNREFQQGALRIEFYEENALIDAIRVLKARNYTIYER